MKEGDARILVQNQKIDRETGKENLKESHHLQVQAQVLVTVEVGVEAEVKVKIDIKEEREEAREVIVTAVAVVVVDQVHVRSIYSILMWICQN